MESVFMAKHLKTRKNRQTGKVESICIKVTQPKDRGKGQDYTNIVTSLFSHESFTTNNKRT